MSIADEIKDLLLNIYNHPHDIEDDDEYIDEQFDKLTKLFKQNEETK